MAPSSRPCLTWVLKEVQKPLARHALSLFATVLCAALRVLPKYNDLRPTHAEGLLGKVCKARLTPLTSAKMSSARRQPEGTNKHLASPKR